MEKTFTHPLLKIENTTPEEKKLIFPQDLVLTKTTIRNLEKIIYPILEGRNLLLVGDAGVGKNALIYYLNRLRQLPTVRFSFNQDTQAEELIGGFRILPQGFHWSDGPLLYSMKQGYTFVADEMNLASPEILARFLSVFDRKTITLYEKDGQEIFAHSRFHFVATQNPTRGFEGRKTIPDTIRNYFTVIHLDSYPMPEEIEIICGLFPQISEDLIKKQVILQRELERLLWKNELAQDDFEHYHFNLRTSKRFWHRVSIKNHDEFEFLKNLLRHYALLFRKKRDIEKALDLISNIFGYPLSVLQSVQQSFYNRSQKTFAFFPKGSADLYPVTQKRLAMLQEIKESLLAQENLLIETDEKNRPEALLEILAQAYGQQIVFLYLSRSTHTGDLIGSLKPKDGSVAWVDGPLTKAIQEGRWVVLDNPEACGSEIIEKLNMLLDDAGMLFLPPEAGEERVIKKPDNFRLIAIKRHRNSRHVATISRAFRNRFFSLQFLASDSMEDITESLDIAFAELFPNFDLTELKRKILLFHEKVNEILENDVLSNSDKIIFGELELVRLASHIAFFAEKSQSSLEEILDIGVEIHYLSRIANLEDREKLREIWQQIRKDIPFSVLEKIFTEIRKQAILKQKSFREISWDPKKNFREPITGRAEIRLNGNELKKGLEINTPETGGQIKEGKDAWYGKDTLGNRGNGVPQGGGGAWGYRTEELLQNFLARYKPRWDYNLNLNFAEFYEFFNKAIADYGVDFHNQVFRNKYRANNFSFVGNRIHSQRYISYLTGNCDDRVFIKNNNEEKREHEVEILFFLNKGRRLFNAHTAVAAVIAIQCAMEILWDLEIPVRVFGYSDIKNRRKSIDLIEYGISSFYSGQVPDLLERKYIFEKICNHWHGDTIEEHVVFSQLPHLFLKESKTRVAIFVSDFRGHRARKYKEQELFCQENQNLKKEIQKLEKLGYVLLGVQLGARNLANFFFQHSVWVHEGNLQKAPFALVESLLRFLKIY